MNESFITERVKALHTKLQQENRKTLIVGISGGIDSAVVLGLLRALQTAYPGFYNVIPLVAPIRDSIGTTEQREAESVGNEVAVQFGYEPHLYHLGELSKTAKNVLSLNTPYLQQQIDYWLRPMAFYAVAMKNENSIIISTTNKSEWELGWFSQYLDIFGIHPVIDLYKSDVYKLAKYLKVPSSVLNIAPKGGLASGETDEDSLGFTYHEFEMYFRFGVNTQNSKNIQKRIDESAFKRNRFNLDFIKNV